MRLLSLCSASSVTEIYLKHLFSRHHSCKLYLSFFFFFRLNFDIPGSRPDDLSRHEVLFIYLFFVPGWLSNWIMNNIPSNYFYRTQRNNCINMLPSSTTRPAHRFYPFDEFTLVRHLDLPSILRLLAFGWISQCSSLGKISSISTAVVSKYKHDIGVKIERKGKGWSGRWTGLHQRLHKNYVAHFIIHSKLEFGSAQSFSSLAWYHS